MDITVKNLGPISEANFTVGDLTVICGKNNTGKTYITYVLYGFLDDWENIDYWILNDADGIDVNFISKIIFNKELEVSIDAFFEKAKDILIHGQSNFKRKLGRILNNNAFLFKDSTVEIKVLLSDVLSNLKINRIKLIESHNQEASLSFEINNDKNIYISLRAYNMQQDDLIAFINDAIKDMVFDCVIPHAFIASAERTGAALFQREVDFTRSRLIDLLKETSINTHELLGRFTAEYPLPVKHNIDFIRDLPNTVNKKSYLVMDNSEIITMFNNIIGGEYFINSAGNISYTPNNQPNLKLSLAESSSTVRSLVDIGFYLKHLAKKGDLLMIDEPELNLHPENQRKIARLFAMLVNAGIRVFITTHSDYIIKEFNTLLLLNKDDERLKELAKREGYQTNELLKPEQLNIYMTAPDTNVVDRKAYTLVPAKITAESGIELKTFDDTIEDMNRIQDEIVWG